MLWSSFDTLQCGWGQALQTADAPGWSGESEGGGGSRIRTHEAFGPKHFKCFAFVRSAIPPRERTS
jgi:hypothetical protein